MDLVAAPPPVPAQRQGPSEASLAAIAALEVSHLLVSHLSIADDPVFRQARRQERLEQDRRDQELLERLQAGEDIDELEDDKKAILKRSASGEEVKVKIESKRCKVTVKEEEIDGKIHLEIQDD
jgi:hypothetical protein